MTLGDDVKVIVDTLLDDVNIRTTMSHTARTFNSTTDGGYSGTVYSSGTVTSLNVVPSRFMTSRLGLYETGDLRQGDFRFIVTSDVTINSNDTLTYNSDTYEVRDVQTILFNEVRVAQIITVSKVV